MSDDERPPDLLIDTSALDFDEEMLIADETISPKALLGPKRIAELVQATVRLKDWNSMIHILAAIIAEPNPKRAHALMLETLRCLFYATKPVESETGEGK